MNINQMMYLHKSFPTQRSKERTIFNCLLVPCRTCHAVYSPKTQPVSMSNKIGKRQIDSVNSMICWIDFPMILTNAKIIDRNREGLINVFYVQHVQQPLEKVPRLLMTEALYQRSSILMDPRQSFGWSVNYCQLSVPFECLKRFNKLNGVQASILSSFYSNWSLRAINMHVLITYIYFNTSVTIFVCS